MEGPGACPGCSGAGESLAAGVVDHPCDWAHAGYSKIQQPPQRYVIIDYPRLLKLAALPTLAEFQAIHRGWVEEKLRNGELERDERWTTPRPGETGLARFDPENAI